MQDDESLLMRNTRPHLGACAPSWNSEGNDPPLLVPRTRTRRRSRRPAVRHQRQTQRVGCPGCPSEAWPTVTFFP